MTLVRPATVLSFLLFIALGCLLVSILSAPIVKRIALATNNNVKFGVFGYCTGANRCTGITLGYNIGPLSSPQDFTLTSKARHTLTNLLIIHPIGALLVLILLVLTIVSHFYGPGHSPGYLLFLIFFSIFTCVVAILAFLVDILLFVPHLAAGGYIVVGAPICLAIVVVGLCATRRRVVGKQDRKRRIAEAANPLNVDPSLNEGFATERNTTGDAGNLRVDSSGGKPPEFETFEVGKPASELDETGERIPLNPRHQSPPPGMSSHRISTDYSQGNYAHVIGRSQSNVSIGSRHPPRSANEYYTGPLPPSHRLPLNGPNGHGVGAFGPNPGRSLYGAPWYGPGPNARGRPGRPYRGGLTPQPVYGGSRVPPQNEYAVGDQGRGLPSTGFSVLYNDPPVQVSNDGNQYDVGIPIVPQSVSPGTQGVGPRRGQSPPQQAWPGQQHGQQQRNQVEVGDYPSDDDSRMDSESRGQPSRQDFIATALTPGPGSAGGRVGELQVPTSPDEPTPKENTPSFRSGGDNYVSRRGQWLNANDQFKDTPIEQVENAVTMHTSPSPAPRHPTLPGPSSEQQKSAELPADEPPSMPPKSSKPFAGDYYEDVDPRFAESLPHTNPVLQGNATADEGMPVMLMSGYNPRNASSRPPRSGSPAQFQGANYGPPRSNPNLEHSYPPRPPNDSQQYVPYSHGRPTFPEYDAPPQSPAVSEQTNFTSISQRPINPRWQPPLGQQPPRGPPRNMPLLSGNLDFELPNLPQGRGGPRGRVLGALPPGLSSDRGGRYPLPPPNMPR